MEKYTKIEKVGEGELSLTWPFYAASSFKSDVNCIKTTQERTVSSTERAVS